MRLLFALILIGFAASAQAAKLENLRLLDGPGSVRAVFQLDAKAAADVFSLEHPNRLVVDLAGVQARAGLKSANLRQGVVSDVRYGRHGKALRVVFDLKSTVHVDHFVLSPGARRVGSKLIVDMTPLRGSPARATAAVAPARTAAPARAKPVKRVAVLRTKPIIIAIDPGHGGKDPGAHGPDGLDEKTVTLAIGKKLAALVDAQAGMKAVLTRKGDYYVGLRQRMAIARKADADLFISIHCNAVRDSQVRGTDVYVLSPRGASSEQARWVADRENAADMVGGVDISDKSSQLASVLVDISQSATLDASFDLADRLLKQMSGIGSLLHPHVQRAAFVVLKAPDIPSVLVETNFITNPHEEHLLGSSRYQRKIAHALLRGIDGYFTQYRPKQRVPVLTASRHGLQPVDYHGSPDH